MMIKRLGLKILFLSAAGLMAVVACGTETVIETVIVTEKGDTVVETVIVTEKGDTVIETVIVTEKGDTVVETVIVEREVAGATLIETVIVTEKGDTVVVTATPVPSPGPTAVPPEKPAPASKNARGELVWAVPELNPGIAGGFNAVALPFNSAQLSVTETLFKPLGNDLSAPYLAETWQLASNGLSATIGLRKGVEFHKGFGELTAEDVAWSFNDTNPNTSVEFGSGEVSVTGGSGSWAALLDTNALEVIDDYQVKISWPVLDVRWQTWFFGQDGLSAAVLSKRAFEENGRIWNLDNIVGSGPYELTQWLRGDRFVVEALPTHWRKTGQVQKITQLAIPDETVRQAMLNTGEADLADVSLRNIPDMQRSGMVAHGSGAAELVSIFFSGNNWETVHAKTGEALDIVTYRHDIPWVGNPHTPSDGNNPEGMDDMEQARLVRRALSLAVDRDLVNEATFSNLGWAFYIPWYNSRNPLYQAKWTLPYDPVEAERLLDLAGYPRGSNGVRFSMPFYGFQSTFRFAPLADAVATFWPVIGVEVEVQHFEYSVFRPSLVARSVVTPWTDSGPNSNATDPWDWARGAQASSLSRGGKGNGVELPQAAEYFQAASIEPDLDKRIALSNDFAEFLFHWTPAMGTVARPRLFVYNPNSLASWPMEPGVRFGYNSPENIVLP